MVTAGLAVYDTMQFVRAPISTFCMGMAMSFGAVLLAAGTKGKRYILPNSRVMIHQPLIRGGIAGQATDVRSRRKEMASNQAAASPRSWPCTAASPTRRSTPTWSATTTCPPRKPMAYGLVDKVLPAVPNK